MESSVFLSDLLTAHERKMRKRLEIKERIFRFMGSLNLQHWTRIGAMNPLLQRKPKRQRTGAVQDLAEARKHVALACVLEFGSLLPLSFESPRAIDA